jgi:ATPase subunit of ABC transporter with duplicated ATPase domains
MAAGLSSNSLFLALDEPENHLDYRTIEWLVGQLSHYRGGLIFISHDQYLVDALADTILELQNGQLTVYSMTYEEYLNEKVRTLEGVGREWEMERKTLQRLQKTVQMLKMKSRFSDSGVGTYRQTKRRYEELKDKHTDSPPKTEADKPKVSLRGVTRKGGKLIVQVEKLSFAYDGKAVFSNADAELRFGEKVVLFGPNGSGKSTLLKLIAGKLTPAQGHIRIGNDVQWEVMTQDHLEGIDPKLSALEVMRERLEWDEVQARSALKRYGLMLAVMDRPLSQLSGGQQARFKLALTFALQPEFLILDEPTNHVDPPTWEAIVRAIQEYEGTVLAITHDRAFIDAIAQKLWVLEGGHIKVHLGTLSDYIHPPKPLFEAKDDYQEHMIDN